MKSLSSVGLGLSIVFGCLVLALIGELYYLLWWKKKFISRDNMKNDYSNPAREFFYMFCWKRSSSLSQTALNPQEMIMTDNLVQDSQSHLHIHSNKDLSFKPFGDEAMESELRRLHSLSGPPRFLFTIIEETKEDLESEDGRSRADNKSRIASRGRSLSDILLTVETPYLTPLASPPFFTPPLTPISCYNQQGFNPLFESAADAEFNKVRSSPPPKFKFLQDAEEKLYKRKLLEEAERSVQNSDESNNHGSKFLQEEEDGPFITIIVDRNRERGFNFHDQQQQFNSSTSQVLPLDSSPTTFRSPATKTSILH